MSSGKENVFSFGIIAENFEVFENENFDCKVLWKVSKGEWNSVGFFVVRSLGRFFGAVFACGYPESAVTPTRRRRKPY